MARREKVVLSDLSYYVVINTRHHNPLFKNKTYEECFDDFMVRTFLEKHDSEIQKILAIDEGRALMLKLRIHPDYAPSSIIYNIKRLTVKPLLKNSELYKQLGGENSIWTRDYVISNNEQGALNEYKLLKNNVY